MKKNLKKKLNNEAISLLPLATKEKKPFDKRALLYAALCSLLCCVLNLTAGLLFGLPHMPLLTFLFAAILPFGTVMLFEKFGRSFSAVLLLVLTAMIIVLQSSAFTDGLYERINTCYAVGSADGFIAPYTVAGGFYARLIYCFCTQLLLAVIISFMFYRPFVFAGRAFIGRKLISTYANGSFIRGALPIFSLIALITAAILTFVPMDPAEKLSAELRADIENEIFDGDIEYTKLPFGKLQDFSAPQYTENVIFKVTMEIPSSLYLPVFIASDFDNGIWRYDTENQYAGLWQWLNQNRFYPLLSFGSYLCGLEGAYASSVRMENYALPADRLLLPYQTVYTFIKEAYGDEQLISPQLLGEREYSFDYVDMDIADFAAENLFDLNIITPKSDEYQHAENAYRAFVYENYLDVPAKYEELLSVCFSPAEYEVLSTAQHHKVVSVFRRYFTDNFTYDDTFTAPQNGSGFLYSFLSGKKGGSYHFATLATLLFRKAGIPARYAEGYALTEDEVYMYAQMDNIAFSVTDSSAHAWVEIYIDEIGWLPVEITPGFYRLNDNEEVIDGIQDVLEDKDEYFFIKDIEADKDEFEQNPQDEKPQQTLPFWQSPWFMLLIIILVLLLIFGSIEARRCLKWRKYRKTNTNDAVIYMYRHLRQTTSAQLGAKKPKALFCYEANEELQALLSEDMQKECIQFTAAAFKARFSDSQLSDAERKQCYQTLQAACRELYQQARFSKKISLWFKGLKASRRDAK